MSWRKTEGIVLQAIRYQEQDQILTVLTPFDGLLKIFCSGTVLAKSGLRGINPSLTKIDLIYREGKRDLCQSKEIVVITPYTHLRQDYERLESGIEMAKAILQSQWPHKPAQELYKLLVYYFEKLKEKISPAILSASFYLKLLKHEGLLVINLECAVCHQLLQDLYAFEGESRCAKDAPEGSIVFSAEEALQLYILTHTRSFKALEGLYFTPTLSEKIKLLCSTLR